MTVALFFAINILPETGWSTYGFHLHRRLVKSPFYCNVQHMQHLGQRLKKLFKQTELESDIDTDKENKIKGKHLRGHKHTDGRMNRIESDR